MGVAKQVYSPLWRLCREGKEEELREALYYFEALGKWEEVNKRGGEYGFEYEDRTCLMAAAASGHEGVVGLLLEQPKLLVNEADYEGWTALHLACLWNKIEVVKKLLTHPFIEMEIKNQQGKTPLMVAVHFTKL